MTSKIKVAISGINGKMGRASAAAIAADAELDLIGALGKAGANYIGKPLKELLTEVKSNILIVEDLTDISQTIDVLLDFTNAETSQILAKQALNNDIRPVLGTSGISASTTAALSELAAAKGMGALIIPNFSLGAVLMMEFAKQASDHFANVEVVEMHHTKKIDAPSGTAMHTLQKLSANGHSFNQQQVVEHELVPGARGGLSPNGVRVHSLRLPGLISHQEVIFGGAGELLTIRHDSFNTDCFMSGVRLAIKEVMELKKLVVGLENILFPSQVCHAGRPS